MRKWTLAAGWMMAMVMLSSDAMAAEQVVGNWIGALHIQPGLDLRIALHFKKTAAGFEGTYDSLDQGRYDQPLSDVAASDGKLGFTTVSHAQFSGTWDVKAHSWGGRWTLQGQSFPVTFTTGTYPPPPAIAGIDGDWDGPLQVGLGARLRLAFHFVTGPHGTQGNFDSIDQQVNGIALSNLHRDGQTVGFDVKTIGASFSGTLDTTGQAMAGQWTQGGMNLPLTITRRAAGATQATLNRPQTPVKPYPYREENVAYDDASAKVKLAGTLTLPQGAGPFPAVVLIAGSGPNTRNEPIFGHQIFLVLADYLTRHGIAVLRFDKRGTGESGGDYASATSADFANDVEASMAYLRGRKEIDARHIGLVGHSEGGLIAPMVAARDRDTAFIVLMAGPGVSGADVLLKQGDLLARAGGAAETDIAAGSELRGKLIAIVREERDPAVAETKLRAAFADFAKAHNVPQRVVDAQIKALNTEWFRYFFAYDPAPALRNLRCPVLALVGSKDLQVPADQNLPALRAALFHNKNAMVEELPNLNHMFQTAQTGGLGEYGQIDETIAPIALDTITNWIVKQTKK